MRVHGYVIQFIYTHHQNPCVQSGPESNHVAKELKEELPAAGPVGLHERQ